jgi:ubiquinone/menaquinone biosynthesis C-methylase UbiE
MASHQHPGNLPAMFRGHPSGVYDFVARRVLRRLYRRIAEDITATARPEARVLDVGTGPGVLLVELAKLRSDLDLTGVDLSSDMVTKAARNVVRFGERVRVQVADVANLPFPDGSFDLVVSSLSMHHWDHPEAAAPELARVLRPGGRIHIYDMRFAPFAVLAGLPDRRTESTAFRTGVPLFPKFTMYVVA